MIDLDSGLIQKIHKAYITCKENEIKSICSYLPKNLLKFSSEEDYRIKTLKSSELWVSSPTQFNDPFDCRLNINCRKFAKEALEKHPLSNLLPNTFEPENQITKMLTIKQEKQNSENMYRLYVACFTEIENLYSLRMWGYYAHNHKGFCAEYDYVDLCQKEVVLPVYYSQKYNQCEKGSNAEDSRRYELSLAFTKSKEWEYEKEWRLLLLNDDKNFDKGKPISFILPKKIYLGCKAGQTLKDEMKSFCKNHQIELYQMEIKQGEYALAFKKCEI